MIDDTRKADIGRYAEKEIICIGRLCFDLQPAARVKNFDGRAVDLAAFPTGNKAAGAHVVSETVFAHEFFAQAPIGRRKIKSLRPF